MASRGCMIATSRAIRNVIEEVEKVATWFDNQYRETPQGPGMQLDAFRGGNPLERIVAISDKWSGKLPRNRLRLCQEDEKSSCRTRDGGGPSGAALQEEASKLP